MTGSLTALGVDGLLLRVGSIAAQHLRVLADLDALALDNLDILETAENLVLHLELGDHGELGALLDLERLVLERRLATRRGEIDGYGVATRRLHGELLDDAHPLVIGIRQVVTAAES